MDPSRRRARSTTPVQGPLLLNPDREQLLRSLADSEGDISQIINRISSVRDTLLKLKMVSSINHIAYFNILDEC